ncbi:hypothetical protein [Thermoplasma volcanium GSS1]|uniref:tRNA/rRNA methyltransferase SpoU type domain-containing protein n=1 Tax=Thermoplasma volcanium (strain ATCC 51530 / DSM 4299 / JCM 9571 / NBRC 15438 / GSS1) TaxID=273116 RepID=Q97B79_THEVO|nr:RNA methyltransferase [Thermoplasma volcanium]BAB59720.1 hypothetical protein [Thermoplasma volcanium GSS1]
MQKTDGLADRIWVVLVQPKYQGNIGAVARSMKNSGLSKLIIVGNRPDDEAFARSMGGRQILENAEIVDSLEEIVHRFTIVAGTSSTASSNLKRFRRLPVDPETFWKQMESQTGKVALVFGREDDGLRNEELDLCNYFIYIPGNPDYPVYNLSHAVAIVLYVMYRSYVPSDMIQHESIKPEHEVLLMSNILDIMKLSRYPAHKMRNAEVMLRRIIGRSMITEREYFKLMGIVRRIKEAIEGNLDEGNNERN